PRVHGQVGLAEGRVDLHGADAGVTTRERMDEPYAGRAVDPLHIELERARCGARGELGLADLCPLEIRQGSDGPHGGNATSAAQVVEPREASFGEQGVHGPTATTAKLRVSLAPDGLPAMHAQSRGARGVDG